MKRLLLAVLFVVSMSKGAVAAEWQILGPRALGMGGAHVAVSNDAHANYWNPAAYGFFGMEGEKNDYSKRSWSAVLSGGLGASVHEDLGERIDSLLEYDYDALTGGSLNPSQVADYIGLINELKTFGDNRNRVAKISTDAGLSIQVGSFGVGVIGLGEVSGRGVIDTVNIAPSGVSILTINEFSDPTNYGCLTCSMVSFDDADNVGLTQAQKNELSAYLSGLPGWTSANVTGYINAIDNGLEQSGGATPADIVDQVKATADLATAAAGAGGSIDNNESNLTFKGIGLVEVPVTYGRALNKNFAVGGNVKFMKARTYDVEVPIFDQDFSDSLDEAQDFDEESTAFGLDLAALYMSNDGNLRFGIVGRNLNSPEFDVERYTYDYVNNRYNAPVSDDMTLDPQVRAGLAYKPFSILVLAVDYDLTENDTTISDDYKSRNLALGAEIDLTVVQLRGGMYKNLAESDIGNVYSLGLGLNLWAVNLDAGVAWTSEKMTIDGDDYPKEVRGELALSMLF